MSRFQFCWYGWAADTRRRLVFERFKGGLRNIYDWRLGIGPFDIRQWCEKWR